MVDDTINVLQEMLARSNELIKVQRNFMNEFGMQVTRACFAAIIKLSGLTEKFEVLMQALDFSLMDLESTEPKDRIDRMVEAAKENHKDSQIIFKEWCNATKMRKWLRDKIAALWSVKEEERLSGDQIEAKKQESV